MASVLPRPFWHLPDATVTPEHLFHRRRDFLKSMGFIGGGITAGLPLIGAETTLLSPPVGRSKPKRNPDFDPKGPLSSESAAISYNNFYEFSTTKTRVRELVGSFRIDPWTVLVDGLCEAPFKLDLAALATAFPVEERVYRFRCVEAWSMVVPWTGFQLSKIIEKAKPKAEAKFVSFTTALRPEEMPGVRRLADYPWPYTEGLRLDEALHPLTFMATGLYGKPLPKQNGAPVRLVVPWKYGYKSIKSVVRIEFTSKQPSTLWETLSPEEYPFESNVDPKISHPRWSQASERNVDTGDRIPSQYLNGYADLVGSLYPNRKA
jgi:methionine sulfoxide reductase catalytic subunit